MRFLSQVAWLSAFSMGLWWCLGHNDVPLPEFVPIQIVRADFRGSEESSDGELAGQDAAVAPEPKFGRVDEHGLFTVFETVPSGRPNRLGRGWKQQPEEPTTGHPIADTPAPATDTSATGPAPGTTNDVAATPVGRQRLSSGSEEQIAAQTDAENQPWKISFQSTDGRPIFTRTLGTGTQRVLIIAGIDGQDRVAVKWVDQLGQAITSRPELLKQGQFCLLRAANPDGLTKRERVNSRGVDLNRNFPSRNLQMVAGKSAGAFPASEVETRAILQLITELQPQRILVVRSGTGTTPDIWHGRTGESLAIAVQKEFRWSARQFDPQRLPGTLDVYVDEILERQFVAISLPVEKNWVAVFPKHQAALLSIISNPTGILSAGRGGLPTRDDRPVWEPFGTLDSAIPQASPSIISPATIGGPRNSGERPASSARRRGYQELPPPP